MPPPTTSLAADLESTAELPVLDPAEFDEPAESVEPADAHHTETWIVPLPPHAEASHPAAEEARALLETSLRKVHAQLRDLQELLAAREARVRQLEDSLAEARDTAEQQLAQLRVVHEEFALATAQHRADLDAGQHVAGAAAQQRATELGNELMQAHELLNAVTTHAAQLQLALDASDAEGRARENAALERRQALVASERAHTGALLDLNAERERNALCLESLHRVESHRQIFDSVVSDLQRETEAHQAALTRLGHELASRDARVARLEQTSNSAAAAGRRETQLPEPKAAQPPPQADSAQLAVDHGELADALAATHTQSAELSAANPPPGEHAAPAGSDAAEARTRELEADLRAAEDTINRLESQARGRGARLEELEKANRQWRLTLEEARAMNTDTGATNATLRATFAPHEAHEAHGAHQAHEDSGHDPLPEGATRLLISKEQGREIVRVLGRKTSVGRTPDNDLQIDAKFISRHHAVILAGPVHTIIEDLNSTNGVLVNGQRVARQMLKDGDDVVIGRTHYRFAVRRAAEKR